MKQILGSEDGHCIFHAEHHQSSSTQAQDNDDIESCNVIINMEIGTLSGNNININLKTMTIVAAAL